MFREGHAILVSMHRALLIGSICASVAPMSSNAQQRLLFDHMGVEEGLPGKEVYAVHQDRNGFIWVGTECGLARLEGTRVRTWFHDRRDQSSLSNQLVSDIAEDDQGNIWVGTARGFQRYLPQANAFSHYLVPTSPGAEQASNRIYDLEPDGQGRIWFLTDDGPGIFHMKEERFERLHASIDPIQGPPSISMASSKPFAWDADRNGMWMATRQGLVFRSYETGEYYGADHDPHSWGCFDRHTTFTPVLDPSGGIWWMDFSTFELVHADPENGSQERWKEMNGDRIDFGTQWMRFDATGRLWISTWTHRLFRSDPRMEQWAEITGGEEDAGSLITTNAKSFLQDRSGTIWLGTYDGLHIAVPERQLLNIVPLAQATENAGITTLFEWDRNLLIYGTGGEGVLCMDRRTGLPMAPIRFATTRAEIAFDANYVQFISRRDSASAWVGTRRGLHVLDIRTRTLRPAREFIGRYPELDRAICVFAVVDSARRVWLGTWNTGLFRYDPLDGSVTHFHDTLTGPLDLPWRGTLCGMRSQKDDIWIGFNKGAGACRFPKGGVPLERHFDQANETMPGFSVVQCLAQGPKGTIWAGTNDGGLLCFDPLSRTTSLFTRTDGLPSDRIDAVVIDNENNVWAMSDRGLAVMRHGSLIFRAIQLPSKYQSWSVGSSLVITSDGLLHFASRSDAITLDPNEIMRDAPLPNVVITSIRTSDSLYRAPPSGIMITLPHDQRSLSVEWGSDAVLDGKKLALAYRLLPDPTLHTIAANGLLDLNELPHGDHRLEMFASLNGVDNGPSNTVVSLTVLPPLWATWWFRVAAASFLATILFIGFRIYLRERLRQQRSIYEREQAVMEERMRIAGDMHDDLGAGLSALKLRSEMALRMEQGPATRQHLTSLASAAGELIDSMRQIIWTMNEDQTGLADLAAYTSSYVRTYCAENGLEVDAKAAGPWPPRKLTTEQRRNIILVVKEGLHNVVKHARANKVMVSISWSDGLDIVLSDDGIGILNGAESGIGNGMRNMRKRITSLGGSFHAQGGEGTTLRVHIPIGNRTNEGSIAVPDQS